MFGMNKTASVLTRCLKLAAAPTDFAANTPTANLQSTTDFLKGIGQAHMAQKPYNQPKTNTPAYGPKNVVPRHKAPKMNAGKFNLGTTDKADPIR